MDLEYKPTVDNITLTKELDEIVTASIKWILEKDLPAMKQMTRLQFWFRKAYDQGKIDSIKTATIEDLKQNSHVQGLLETLERLSHYEIYSSAIDRGVYKESRTAQGQLDILTDAARAKLKEWVK